MEPKVLIRRALLLLLLALSRGVAAQAEVNFASGLPNRVLLPRLVASMSDSELLGQVFLLGYSGSLLTPRIMAWVSGTSARAVITFG